MPSLRNRSHFLFFFSLWITVCSFCLWTTSCGSPSHTNGGTTPTPAPTPVGSGGSVTFTLTFEGSGKIAYSFTPACTSQAHYLICTLNIFNTQLAALSPTTYPLMYAATYSYPCSSYSPQIQKTGIPCDTLCANNNDKCIWATLICINTSMGNALTINAMPENITCVN